MKRTQIITSERYLDASRAATRAGLASPDVYTAVRAARSAFDTMLERWEFVVDAPTLELAAGRFEGVSSLALREVIKDAQHELARRKPERRGGMSSKDDYETYIVVLGRRHGKRYAERKPLNVPVALATGNYEALSGLQVREFLHDMQAESDRRNG